MIDKDQLQRLAARVTRRCDAEIDRLAVLMWCDGRARAGWSIAVRDPYVVAGGDPGRLIFDYLVLAVPPGGEPPAPCRLVWPGALLTPPVRGAVG